jgi:hypothetical protein
MEIKKKEEARKGRRGKGRRKVLRKKCEKNRGKGS